MSIGDIVMVDRRYKARVRELWPEGSTSYAFPHAKIVYGDENGPEDDYADPHVVALSRLSPCPEG